MKRCIYCKCQISDESIIDFCEKCGKSSFGDRLYYAIIQKMREAKERGDLEQGKIF